MDICLQRVEAACITLVSFLLAPAAHPSQRIGELHTPAAPPASSPGLVNDHQASDITSRTISFDVAEGTFMSIDVSPDGGSLVFDLLGDIYLLPMEGGEAIAVTTGRAWDKAPLFAPDGESVYFVSDRKGFKNIWQIQFADGSLDQVTASESDIMGTPNWAQDQSTLLAGFGDGTNNSEVILQLIDPSTGQMSSVDPPTTPAFDWTTLELIRPHITIYSGVQTIDGQIYFAEEHFDEKSGDIAVRLYTFDPKNQTRERVTPLDVPYSEYKPQLSHDGNLLAYFRQYSDRRTEIIILDRTTGRRTAVLELTGADDAFYGASQELRPNYAFTPDDRHLVFWHGGKIHQLDLTDGSTEIIPFRVKVVREVWERAKPSVQYIDESGEAQVIRWPSLSRDGNTMAFAAIGYVWVMDLRTKQIRRLTRADDFEYMPSISPDGRMIAYVSFANSEDGYGSGRLMVAVVDTGVARELLAVSGESYLLPTWSENGKKIAVIREVEGSGGTSASFGWTPAESGEFHEVARAPASDEYLSGRIYARFVGFDGTGDRLLFSYSVSRTRTILASADLHGNDRRTLAVGGREIGGITPAPDLTNLALNRRDGTVWVVPFGSSYIRNPVSTSSPGARRVSDGSGYYVGWNGSDQITFGFAQNVYRHNLDRAEAESFHIRLAFEKATFTQPLAFTGARLITMSSCGDAPSVIEKGTIVLDGLRISAVGAATEVAIPPDAIVINAKDETIMPGLLDVHYHRIGGSGGAIGTSALKLPRPGFEDRSAIAYGITTAWEPGGPWDDGVPATADLRHAGRIRGPRWSHSAMGTVGYPWEQLSTYTKALFAVEQASELGVVVLKEYNTPTRTQRQWLSAAAREKGLGIVSHINSFESMMTRILDGYTGGDHSYFTVPFYKDVRELLRRTGYIWTPNIMITSGSLGGYSDTRAYFWREVLSKRPRELDKLTAMTPADRFSQTMIKNPSVPYQIHRASRVAEQAAEAASHGVHIGVSGHSMPGANLHGEMWYLWKGGLAIEDVLCAATIGNAKKLGLQEEVGSLEVGKVADLLVLDDNPLDDIINTLSIKYTVQGGVVYDSNTAKKVDPANLSQ